MTQMILSKGIKPNLLLKISLRDIALAIKGFFHLSLEKILLELL